MGRTSKRLAAVKRHGVSSNAGDVLQGKRYKAGIYARLSADPDKKGGRNTSKEARASQSESLEVQIKIAMKFVEAWNQKHMDKIEVAEYYIDSGKTGINFNREAFKRLMQDVRMGDINCVIVKDLSRFGRNYLEAGNYIEKVFPFLGVRFIAVADGYDTNAGGNETEQMVSEIKNLVNDMYAKDFSVKAKTSLAQRRKEGSYVGGPAPYGYKAQWEGRLRKLVPDENTAEIVRYIFHEYIATESCTAVADDLNSRKINPPAVYQKTGEVYCPSDAAFKGWNRGGVERIIKSDTYSGRLVQGKTSITARDESSRIHKAEDEWVVREDTHEPLIDKETFKEAGRIWKRQRELTKKHGHPTKDCPIAKNIFDRVLYCGVCGQKMTRHSHVRQYADGSKRRLDGYTCLNSGSTKTNNCPFPNHISKTELTNILHCLFETELAVRLKKQKIYMEAAKNMVRKKQTELERSLQSVVHAMERLNGEESKKYMAYRMGSLSQQEYLADKMQKEIQCRELEKQEHRLKEQISDLERNGEIYLKAVRALVKWKKDIPLKKDRILTKELVETLIEKIYLYPGKRVEVLFCYMDELMGG